jgi:hypothetical protein
MRIAGKRQSRRGIALVAIFLMLAIFASVAVLLATMGANNQRNAHLEARSDEALYAAEAGLVATTERYLTDESFQVAPEPEAFGSQGQTFEATIYRDGEISRTGIEVPVNHVFIEVTGYSRGGQSRTVGALLSEREPTQSQDNAVVAGSGVEVENGSIEVMPVLASYASFSEPFKSISGAPQKGLSAMLGARSSLSAPLKSDPAPLSTSLSPLPTSGIAHVAVESSNDGAIVLGSEGSVDGNLRIPAGAQPEFTVDDNSGGQHGGIVDSYIPPTLVPVRLPMVAGDLNITLNASTDPKNLTGALKDVFKGGELKPGAYGDVVVDGGTLELNTEDILGLSGSGKAPKDLYVFKSLTLKNGGTVALRGKAKDVGLAAMVYIDSSLSIVDGAIVNETLNPAFLQMYIASNGEVVIDNEAESYNTLYAPGSDVLIRGASLYGSVVARNVSLTDGAHIFYDPALATFRPDPWGNGGFYTVRKSYRRD